MFEIEIGTDGRIALAGRLDAAEADRAMEVLKALEGPLVADCSRLDYISSAGIGVIIEVYKKLHKAGHVLRLVHMTPRVRNVFRYAGLDQILTIE